MEKIKIAARKAALWTAAALAGVLLLCAAARYGITLAEGSADEMNETEFTAGGAEGFSLLFPVGAFNGCRAENSAPELPGAVPVRGAVAEKGERPVLTVCGTPFGLKIETDGVMVTGFGAADGSENGSSPAELAGIEAGDVIIKINGMKVCSSQEIAGVLNLRGACYNNTSEAMSASKVRAGKSRMLSAASGSPVRVTVMRNGRRMEFEVVPEESEGCYRLGIWTRDSCAGIGTLTFYDEAHNIFAGLGHSVCDIDTGVTLPVGKGEIVPVSISSVIRGVSGCPGELCGSFMSGSPSGKITGNYAEGIFGQAVNSGVFAGRKLEMSFSREVHPGEAKILATVSGMTPEEYSVYIEKADRGGTGVKNLVVRITDPRLLAATGGIVQGMSGSPIIQDGRLAGAVTHVFVNDVTRGYGIFAENMYANVK